MPVLLSDAAAFYCHSIWQFRVGVEGDPPGTRHQFSSGALVRRQPLSEQINVYSKPLVGVSLSLIMGEMSVYVV